MEERVVCLHAFVKTEVTKKVGYKSGSFRDLYSEPPNLRTYFEKSRNEKSDEKFGDTFSTIFIGEKVEF